MSLILVVAATLEDVKNNTDFIPKEQTKERMAVLGIQTLLDTNNMNPLKSLNILEEATWKLASHVKKRRFGYKKDDFIDSLKFLEVFCLYSAQANSINQRNTKVLKNNIDKNVMKAIKEIEYINKMLETYTKKYEKAVLKQHTERLTSLINKIFTENLNQTEQIAMGKIVQKAENILQKMVK